MPGLNAMLIRKSEESLLEAQWPYGDTIHEEGSHAKRWGWLKMQMLWEDPQIHSHARTVGDNGLASQCHPKERSYIIHWNIIH